MATSPFFPAPPFGYSGYPSAATPATPAFGSFPFGFSPASAYAPAPAFPSPITTQIDPNQPPPAATQVHGDLHHTSFGCPILSFRHHEQNHHHHHFPPTTNHLLVQAAPQPTSTYLSPIQEVSSPAAYQSTPSSAQPWVASAPSRALDPRAQQNGDLSSSKTASANRSSIGLFSPASASDLPAPAASHVSSGTNEVRKYLAYDEDTASVHSTVTQNPFSTLAPSYESTCSQPCDYQQGASSDSYAHKVFETMPSLQGRLLTVKLHHKVCPISIEKLHRIFLSCGVVEKMICVAHVHSPRVFIQYQNDQMAAQAIWVLQGKCIPETYCQLEIQLSQGSDLHTFQDYICEMNFQSGPGGYNVGHNINESPGEGEHKRETIQQILSSLPGPNTDGFDTMDHKAHTVDRRMSILNMLAPIQAKLQNITENLSQDLERMESRASKQHPAPQLKPSTQHAINVTDEKPLYGVYAEEDNGSPIGLCTVLHTNFIIQRDGEGKQDTEDTSNYLSKASDNEISSQQPPMSATATDHMQFQAFESMTNFDEYAEEDSASLNIISDVRDFTLELQQQDDDRACNCPVIEASNSSAHTHFNFLSCNTKQLSAIQPIQGNCLSLEAIPSWQRGPFSLGYFAISDLWCNTTRAGDKIFGGLNTAANSQNVLPCISISDTEHICLFVKLSPWSILSAQHFLDSTMKKGRIFSPERTLPCNPRYAILLLHHFLWQFSIRPATRLKWDPGVKVSLDCWLDVLTAWSENDKPLSCTRIPGLAALQTQSVGITASYVWNPGSMLFQYKSITEEKENVTLIPQQWSFLFKAVHCCQIFQRCTAMSSLLYWHQHIKFNGIALWLITFNPP